MIAYLLSRGWAVVTADYEGPESDFLAARFAGVAAVDDCGRCIRQVHPASRTVRAQSG
uniref:lipase family protein n=1 Tax=Rhodococcus oxybenzonivorans TaxID=1990687 RepID=UPI0037C776D5